MDQLTFNFFGLFLAVDDIEEGKGADEELCLLPDEEEREISDADRERAMANQQQVADENDEIENENENENELESDTHDANLEAIEENGEQHFLFIQFDYS